MFFTVDTENLKQTTEDSLLWLVYTTYHTLKNKYTHKLLLSSSQNSNRRRQDSMGTWTRYLWANIKTGLLALTSIYSTSRMNPVIPIQETSYTNTGRSAYSEARRLPAGFSAQTVQKTRVLFVCTGDKGSSKSCIPTVEKRNGTKNEILMGINMA